MYFGRRMRTAVTIVVVLVYWLLFNFYISELTHERWLTTAGVKIFYTLLTSGMVVFYLLDKHFRYVSPIHRQYSLVCIGSVFCNWILILLTLCAVFDNAEAKFYWFNGLMFANTLIISICMKYYGLFNK